MAFTIDESFLPATLTAPPMTDEQFAEFCAEHEDLCFEMSAEGELIVMLPAFTLDGVRNARIGSKLSSWADQDGRGVVCAASAGFVLPNGARRSPDASWTDRSQIEKLSKESFEGFWHLCPYFVIELKSRTDRIKIVRQKMREYIANGAQLGWLIDPERRTVEIYRPDREPELLAEMMSVAGEGPVRGFVLTLAKVWEPLG